MDAILGGKRPQLTWEANEEFSAKHDRTDSDSSDSDHENQRLEETNHILHTESEQLQEMLDNTTRSLLKLSIVIQKTSSKARSIKSSSNFTFTGPFNAFGISKVFPDAKNRRLLEKLSKASNERYQYLFSNKFQESKDKLGNSVSPFSSFNRNPCPEVNSVTPMDDKDPLAAFSHRSELFDLMSPPTSINSFDELNPKESYTFSDEYDPMSSFQDFGASWRPHSLDATTKSLAHSFISYGPGLNDILFQSRDSATSFHFVKIPFGVTLEYSFKCDLCQNSINIDSEEAWMYEPVYLSSNY